MIWPWEKWWCRGTELEMWTQKPIFNLYNLKNFEFRFLFRGALSLVKLLENSDRLCVWFQASGWVNISVLKNIRNLPKISADIEVICPPLNIINAVLLLIFEEKTKKAVSRAHNRQKYGIFCQESLFYMKWCSLYVVCGTASHDS